MYEACACRINGKYCVNSIVVIVLSYPFKIERGELLILILSVPQHLDSYSFWKMNQQASVLIADMRH